MLWHWLRLSKLFNKIGNYFYSPHVATLRKKQRKELEMHKGYGMKSKPMKKKKKAVKKKKK